MTEKTVIGLIETIKIQGKQTKSAAARIDTGATMSSIDVGLSISAGLGPILHTKTIRSATGRTSRPIVEADIEICGKKMRAKFSVANRTHMKYQVLIGQNILRQGFLIDPSRNDHRL